MQFTAPSLESLTLPPIRTQAQLITTSHQVSVSLTPEACASTTVVHQLLSLPHTPSPPHPHTLTLSASHPHSLTQHASHAADEGEDAALWSLAARVAGREGGETSAVHNTTAT